MFPVIPKLNPRNKICLWENKWRGKKQGYIWDRVIIDSFFFCSGKVIPKASEEGPKTASEKATEAPSYKNTENQMYFAVYTLGSLSPITLNKKARTKPMLPVIPKVNPNPKTFF